MKAALKPSSEMSPTRLEDGDGKDSDMPHKLEQSDLGEAVEVEDAVFGQITREGPNYRNVRANICLAEQAKL